MPDIDLEQLQKDLLARLNANEYFVDVTVVSLRKLQIASEINAALVYLTDKAGKKGAGVIVGMPSINVPSPNVAGPEREVVISCRVMEQPTISQDVAGGGSGKTAEAIALSIQDELHQLGIEGLCDLYAGRSSQNDPGAITPNTDLEGVVAYDVFFRAMMPRTQTSRCITPSGSGSAATLVTLVNNEPGSTLYYTVGSAPGVVPLLPWSGEPTAAIYTAPFAVSSGTIVRFASYKTGKLGSDVAQATVT